MKNLLLILTLGCASAFGQSKLSHPLEFANDTVKEVSLKNLGAVSSTLYSVSDATARKTLATYAPLEVTPYRGMRVNELDTSNIYILENAADVTDDESWTYEGLGHGAKIPPVYLPDEIDARLSVLGGTTTDIAEAELGEFEIAVDTDEKMVVFGDGAGGVVYPLSSVVETDSIVIANSEVASVNGIYDRDGEADGMPRWTKRGSVPVNFDVEGSGIAYLLEPPFGGFYRIVEDGETMLLEDMGEDSPLSPSAEWWDPSYSFQDTSITLGWHAATARPTAAGKHLISTDPPTLIKPVRLKGYTVSTLPTGGQGDVAFVTDATSPTYLGTLTGGGSVVCPVFHNGTAWVSH